MKKIIIVGLGNPESKYENTRHNLGFKFVDTLVSKFKKNRDCSFLYAEAQKFIVVKPLTYMNRSGIAVRCIMNKLNIDLEKLLVICDDFNLPHGKLRLRPSGSSGGHNGLQSIIDYTGTTEFPRLRLGIGGMDVIDKIGYVLENFNRRELKIIEDMLIDARLFVDYYIKNGIDSTMNKFNSKIVKSKG